MGRLEEGMESSNSSDWIFGKSRKLPMPQQSIQDTMVS